MPVCVGDTIHIVEQDTGKSTQIPITNLIGRRYLCLSVPGNSKIKHCGILLNIPYFSDEFSNFQCYHRCLVAARCHYKDGVILLLSRTYCLAPSSNVPVSGCRAQKRYYRPMQIRYNVHIRVIIFLQYQLIGVVNNYLCPRVVSDFSFIKMFSLALEASHYQDFII